ncbi:MAG: hypothetical protein KDA52_08105 [Planctomycetaceae bacterium]|nr:hypothetical protein [Planctomycetaceae bacterium]
MNERFAAMLTLVESNTNQSAFVQFADAMPGSFVGIEKLQAQIVHEHTIGKQEHLSALTHFKTAGELLIQAKEQLQHGEWEGFKKKLPFSPRTAESYMYLARHWAVLTSHPQSVADLSLNGAIEYLRTLRPPKFKRKGNTTRSELHAMLALVNPGLESKVLVEQCDHFVFKNRKLITFNDAVLCQCPTEFDFEGAVKAKTLMRVLESHPEDHFKLDRVGDVLRIEGSTCQVDLNLRKIELPYEDIAEAGDWKPLDPSFCEAVRLAEEYTSPDASIFDDQCVYVHPEHIDAFWDWRAIRIKLQTPIEEPFAIHRYAARHIARHEMTELSITEKYAHFRNAAGLQYSTYDYFESLKPQDMHAKEFERVSERNKELAEEWRAEALRKKELGYVSPLDHLLAQDRVPITLPKQLKKMLPVADVISKTNMGMALLEIKLEQDVCTLRSIGEDGVFMSSVKCTYDGEPIKALTRRDMLEEILKLDGQIELISKGIVVTTEDTQRVFGIFNHWYNFSEFEALDAG